MHFDAFKLTCVDFVNRALDADSSWRLRAEQLDWGDADSDGVAANVDAFDALLVEGIEPVDTRSQQQAPRGGSRAATR